MKIVKMTLETIPYVAQLGKELHGLGTFGTYGPEFDWDYTITQLLRIESSPRHYVRCAVDDDDMYVGGVFGHLDTFFFSPKLMALEDGWYVREGTRDRAKVAVALMRGFMSWALDVHNVVLIQTGDIAGINTLGVDAIYKRLGFERFGVVYKYQRK